jgi:hypothetical protein
VPETTDEAIMILLLKKTAFTLGVLSFFLIFIIGVDPENLFDLPTLMRAFVKGCCGLALFWFCGIVMGDIVFKGIVNEMQEEKFENLEGGFLQRFIEVKNKDSLKVIPADKVAPQAPEK